MAAINRKALELLYIYTAHTFDMDRLRGDSMKEQRRQILSALMGQRMPASKAGVSVITRHFYLMPGGVMDECQTDQQRQVRFTDWARVQVHAFGDALYTPCKAGEGYVHMNPIQADKCMICHPELRITPVTRKDLVEVVSAFVEGCERGEAVGEVFFSNLLDKAREILGTVKSETSLIE